MVEKKCFFCGKKSLRPFAFINPKPQHLHSSQCRCSICGLVVGQPQLIEQELKTYYKQHFYQQQWPDAQGTWDANINNYQRQEFPLIKRICSGWLPSDGCRALEIGCGYGSFLRILRNQGYDACGVDISPKAVAFCNSKGLSVVEASWQDIPFKSGIFDLVVSMYVIEHVDNPRLFIRECVRLLRSGGVVVLLTDDADDCQYAWLRWMALISGRDLPFCSSSDHTFVFRGSHIKSLLEEGGCQDVRINKFDFVPEQESFHWHIYKNLFRFLNRMTGRGGFILSAGRRSDR